MFLICSGLIFFLKNIKENKAVSIIMVLIPSVAILLLYYIPFDDFYLKIYYETNKESMNKIVEMLKSDTMKDYQIGEKKFLIPEKMRLFSDAGYIFKDYYLSKNVFFYVQCGFFRSSAIMFVPDNIEIINESITKVQKLDENWYSVIIE